MAVLEPAAYGGYKDASAAGGLAVATWPAAARGSQELEVPAELRDAWEERVAIMVADGGVPRAAAARLAWGYLQPQEAAR